ncbi:zonadhesin isoform X1 [Astyanax mexicanus]|uniref:zonadhesin isoform X1 n=1 Tax=Astyanax mexicanus TaxID=7994 RepID=UPI0020CB1810|nr:zonadhesin isoform X1 [Astyanax mexicanus]
MISQCRECDGGHYCSQQNATSVSGECAAGFYCTRGNISPQPQSSFTGEGGPCPAGQYCPRGSTDPQPCPEGTFSNRSKLTSKDECVLCTPGHYCDVSGLTAPTGQCWEGFYCRHGASVPNALIRDSRGGPCPTGYFCPRGSSAPQDCPQGSITSSEGQASCSLCPQGYYCPSNGSLAEGIDCPPGHYCPTGTSSKNQYPCPPGTINPYTRMGSVEGCAPCSPGYFCEAPGQSSASGPCEAGHFCLSGAASPTPDDGQTGDRCPPGHYCPIGSSSPLPCPIGRYNSISMSTELSACLPCPAGFACSSRGLSAPSHVCLAGYYCPPGQNSSQPAEYTCSPGHMCPPGSPVQTPCAPGTFQSLHGQAECLLCPSGFFCAGSADPETGIMGGTSTPAPCPVGHYCPAGTSSGLEFPCSIGTYSGDLALSSKEQCVPCPAGRYCASSGLSSPTADCSPGYLCIQGATVSQPPGDATGRRCSAGFYCPAGTNHMRPCPPGTFSSLEGAASSEECQPCTPGQFCAEYGLSSPSGPCSPGYYCTLKASSQTPHQNRSTELKERAHYPEDELDLVQITGDICARGHYCPSGSSQPLPCPPGTFLGRRGAVSESDCDPCLPGFYCPAWGQNSVEIGCPEGWFCPAGSVIGREPGHQCPPGHACPYGSVEPAICPSGAYQSQPAQPYCQPCPPGFYCLEGASAPVPCPAGTMSPVEGLQSPLDCSLCPPGFYCNTTALTSPSGACNAGHFCSSGATESAPVSQRYGDVCPAGWYCPQQSSAPVPCPVGHYFSDKGASSLTFCSPCPPGRYCHTPGSSQPSGFCSPGHYCTGSAETAAPQAKPIQLRCFCNFIPESSQAEYSLCAQRDSTRCLTGEGEEGCTDSDLSPASDSENSESNSELTLDGKQVECSDFRGDVCPVGFYCPVGSSLPQPCDPGSHCNQTGLQAPAGLCASGFFCSKGTKDPYAAPCPPGHYCPRGTPVPLPCLPGTLRPSVGGSSLEDCLACPSGYFCELRGLIQPSGRCSEGYYCPGGQNSSRPAEHRCRAGHYCEEGSISDRACPVGSYQPLEGLQRCEVCPAGFFCPAEGMINPVPCRPGFYCPAGAANQQPCPAGTYSNQSGLTESSECTQCSPGSYCSGTGNTSPSGPCSAGFLCFGGASLPSPTGNVTGTQCPPGFYCLTGSFTATPCPKGTFSVQQGLTEAAQCRKCSPGFYCSEPGLSSVSGPCLPGFFCTEGSSTAAPVSALFGDVCPPGHYCETGSAVPTSCPVGTHRSESGGKSVEACMSCPEGLFQDQSGQRDCKACLPGFHCLSSAQQTNRGGAPLICPKGYYCPNETLGRPVPCPKGTYSDNQGLTSADECLVCPLGYFCGSDGLVQPSGPCASGFLCFIRATVPNPTDNQTGSLCPAGAFCQLGIRNGDCSPGYFCDWGSSSPEQRLCPSGFFCPAGIDKPVACGPGTFSSVMGNSERDNCDPCPSGFYCQGDGVVEPVICPKGFYCPQGTVLDTDFPCPQGTVGLHPGATSEENCSPCPSGMFCALPGLSEPTGHCQDGYHCPSGAISPNATGHQMESAGNNMCPPGHYCPVGTGYPLPCPPGTLSSSPGLSAVEQCQPCPPGHFCEQPAMSSPSDALLCDAGYVCLGGSRSARPIDGLEGYLCPSGHSCPIGSPVEVPCEPGTYSSAPGASHCLFCPAGTMCPSAATQEPAPCPKGYFCPAGTATAVPCPVGTLGQVNRAQSESACTPCPTGLFCSLPGASQPQGSCQQGYFCQSGSAYPAPLNTSGSLINGPCPQGHYCPSGTLNPMPCPAGSMRNLSGGYSMESCMPCPAGHYCAGEGLDSPSGPCAAGFYCPADFSSTTPHAFLCSKGHYCPVGSPWALPCPTGQYQPNPGSDSCIPCRPGFYCEEAVVGDPLPCPPHSYCPAATMVPQPCPNGTYTPLDVGGLQDEKECLSCPPGRFCRGGQIKGVCAAGYLCISGSSDFTPQGRAPADRSRCEWGMQCAGPCPAGFYCPEAADQPHPCPANTVKETPGGSSIQDCLPCPPKHWCKESDPVLYLCPEGHYCDGIDDYESEGRPGPRPCPSFTYRPTPGAGSKGDCLRCPPGTFCNATGLTDFSSFPCPPGYWCSGTGLPVFCPGGTLRAQPGATSAIQCEPCAAGSYCPDPRRTGQPNTAGIPCRASYQCPTGSVEETPCTAGSYCGPQTGEPTACPAGYHCPEASHTYNTPEQVCMFPFYCPANSSTMFSCAGGFMPRNISGLRVSQDSSCVQCEAGTYRPSHSPHLRCLTCPPGYLCHPGAENYSSQPCPIGYVCPQGSSLPVPCPPGTYGNHTNAELIEECQQCPPDTFNHLESQRACFPCGSSSHSERGASSCVCIGKNRVFQHSDGSCLCKTGYVFYNELDFKSSSTDSDLDCQPEVSKRCGVGQVRLASSQECVNPSTHSCSLSCGPQGGSLDVGLGICHCERYVSAEEVCNSSCVSTLPELSTRLAQDGQLLLRIKAKDENRMWNRNMMNILGPDSHINNIGKIHLVQFSAEGVFGWILKDPLFIDTFLSEPIEILEGGRRKRRHSGDLWSSGPLPRIPNPIACLNPSDMLIFQLTINYTDRLLSHFPVYQKDHLFSSNPAWDFGAFRHLERLIKHSQFNSTRFAHVFSEPGKYVFLDNAVKDWSLIVVVRDKSTECDPTTSPFQPTSPAQLVRHGVIKQQRLNLLPDWSAIIGVLILLVLLIVVLTVSALLLRPNRSSLIAKGRPKPKWRSLGEPKVPMEYVYSGDCSGMLRFRGVGEGAEAEEPAVCKGYKNALIELEEFNVKTLYDKLEDQNLHLASQLAKHRKDTQEFYRNMCQQTDALRETLENMEPSKRIQWKKIMASEAQAKQESIRVEPWMGLMEVVQRSLEAVLIRLNEETYQQPESTVTGSHRDTRESGVHTGYTQISSADMIELKTRPDTEAASSDPAPQSSTAPCVSEEDLAKLLALTPLTKTLQDIQQSLQALNDTPHAEEEPRASSEDTEERQQAHLIPVALDNLSPRSFAVFLFGCHVVRLLSRACGFPAVMLLLAKTLPVTQTDSLLNYCNREFYYDTSNQILYILHSNLQNAGHFISVLLHALAYITSGSAPRDFIRSLHLAVSALSLQLFHLSFTQEQQEGKMDEERSQLAFGTLVEDFLSVKVSTETQFTPSLLAERLQKYKYFKLEQLLQELKPPPSSRPTEGSSPTNLKLPVQMLCVEQEIQHLNEVYQQLSSQLHSRTHTLTHTHTHRPLEQSQTQTQLNKGLQEQVLMLKLQQVTVEQRLREMKERLSKLSSDKERSERNEQSVSESTEQQIHKDSLAFSKHTQLNNGADNQTDASEQLPSKKQHSRHMDDVALEKRML